MQIHELNTFAGALGANVFLPVDNGADTGKLSFADLFGDGSTEVLWSGALNTGTATLSDAVTNYESITIHYKEVNSGVIKSVNIPTSQISIDTAFPISIEGLTVSSGNVLDEYIYMTYIKFATTTSLAVVSRWAFTWDGTNSPDKEEASYATTSITQIDGIRPPANKQGVILLKTVTVEAANWNGTTNTVTVSDVTSASSVLVCPIPSDQTSALGFGVYCSGQGTNSLTFSCTTTPTVDIEYNVMVVG